MLLYHSTRKQNAGFVLIMVLVILQMLLLMTWCTLESSLLLFKTSQHIYDSHILFNDAFIALKKAEEAVLLNNVSCQIPVTPFSTLMQKTSRYWSSETVCHNVIKGHSYYQYVVEFLASNPCLQVVDVLGIKKTADYFRVTVRMASMNQQNDPIFLQSTVIKPNKDLLACYDILQTGLVGRQSFWVGEAEEKSHG